MLPRATKLRGGGWVEWHPSHRLPWLLVKLVNSGADSAELLRGDACEGGQGGMGADVPHQPPTPVTSALTTSFHTPYLCLHLTCDLQHCVQKPPVVQLDLKLPQ